MSDRHTPERSVLVGDISIALLHIAQAGAEPMVFAVIAGGVQRGPLQTDVSTGGNVGTGRQYAAGFTVQDAIDIGNALSAAIGVLERSWQLTAIQALADGMQGCAFHLDVSAAFGVRPARL